ncbi:carbon storage regulator CsrA [Pseudobutyrivibrio sp.]|uniref:carbon storage regulator CsrA n=1 Tax=Pseudobutyrivibrio sp. TaxID=2014367 RepID=UPI001D8416C0|nr:carbon storage regulator CsrA [Pseudobutyrivibrio sp.]MBE5910616.1 carbon storage regulator CsrA [Pseudobutyrivibrio sp.]
MLALTRKTGDAIMINNNIEITVLEVRGDQVKIGISAPKEVSIYRKEVYLEIQKENEAAQEAAQSISLDDIEALKNLL